MKKYEIPQEGIPEKELLEQMDGFRQNDTNYVDGKTWSLVYQLSDKHTEFLKKAYTKYISENGLNPMAFKSLKRMEYEVVRMALNLLHGDENSVGVMTSGGTESILLSVKTYRDLYRHKNKSLLPRLRHRQPEMILPETAHIGFHKAAHYFDIKVVIAPLTADKRVDVKAVKKRINKNTMLIVGSAPSYPFGTIDPIEELGHLAKRKNIPLHIDACLGGFLLPFVEKAGYQLPAYDFRVPGVTSMSADVHKYGYAAKGASVILYRNMDYLKHQFFVESKWIGGMFISPGILGTRPGGAIAAAWATLMHIGQKQYTQIARQLMQTAQEMRKGIGSIPELEILGQPDASVFAYHSTDNNVDIYAVADQMEKRGWHIDRQQKPPAMHATVSPIHHISADKYISDLRDSVAHVKAHPELKASGNAAVYGMMAKLPLRGQLNNELRKIMEGMYGPEGELPDLENQEHDLKTLLAETYIQAKETVDRIIGR